MATKGTSLETMLQKKGPMVLSTLKVVAAVGLLGLAFSPYLYV